MQACKASKLGIQGLRRVALGLSLPERLGLVVTGAGPADDGAGVQRASDPICVLSRQGIIDQVGLGEVIGEATTLARVSWWGWIGRGWWLRHGLK
jgi:hypothetical protein